MTGINPSLLPGSFDYTGRKLEGNLQDTF